MKQTREAAEANKKLDTYLFDLSQGTTYSLRQSEDKQEQQACADRLKGDTMSRESEGKSKLHKGLCIGPKSAERGSQHMRYVGRGDRGILEDP